MIAFDIVVTAMQNGRLVSDKLTLIYHPCLDATEQLGAESGPVVLPQGQARAEVSSPVHVWLQKGRWRAEGRDEHASLGRSGPLRTRVLRAHLRQAEHAPLDIAQGCATRSNQEKL